MSSTVAILGATDVYGRHLVPRLLAAGYRVRTLVRTPEAALACKACGAEIHTADIFDGTSLREGRAGCDAAINLATTLPLPAKSGGDFDLNDLAHKYKSQTTAAYQRGQKPEKRRALMKDWAEFLAGSNVIQLREVG